MDQRFAQIPEWVIYHPDMPRDGHLLWLHIQRHSHLRNGCSKSVATLSQEIGRSVSWIKRTLSRLVGIGVIKAVRRAGRHAGRTHTNTYETVWDKPREVVVDLRQPRGNGSSQTHFDTSGNLPEEVENGPGLTQPEADKMVQGRTIKEPENGSVLTYKRKEVHREEKQRDTRTSSRRDEALEEGKVLPSEGMVITEEPRSGEETTMSRMSNPRGSDQADDMQSIGALPSDAPTVPVARKAKGLRKPVPEWNANDLSEYFRQRGMRRNPMYPDQYSVRPLAGSFRRWRDDHGVTPEVMKSMIDAFMDDDSNWRSVGTKHKVWVRFLHWGGSNIGTFMRSAEDTYADNDDDFDAQLRRKGLAL